MDSLPSRHLPGVVLVSLFLTLSIFCRRHSGVLTVNFEHISHPCSGVSVVNFEHVIAGWVWRILCIYRHQWKIACE